MGQICSRRKRKLSDHVGTEMTEQSTIGSSDLPFPQSSGSITSSSTPLDQFKNFLKQEGLDNLRDDVSADLETVFSSSDCATDRVNLYLNDVITFSDRIKELSPSVELKDLRFPVCGFNYVDNCAYIPSSLSNSLFKPGSRLQLIAWYICQSTMVFEKREFLSVVIRMLLGKRPKAVLGDLEDVENLSESVTVLLLVYYMLDLMAPIDESTDADPLASLLAVSGEQFIGLILTNNTELLWSIRKISNNCSEIFLKDVQAAIPETPIKVLQDLARNPSLDDLILAHVVRSVRSPMLHSKRDKARQLHAFTEAARIARESALSLPVSERIVSDSEKLTRFVLDIIYSSNIEIDCEILETVEALYQLLPSHLEGDSGLMDEADGLERHIETARMICITFSYEKRVSFADLRAMSANCEYILIACIRSGLRQWTNRENIFTHKAAENWWNGLVGNIEVLAGSLHIHPLGWSFELLLRELVRFWSANHEELLVEPELVLSVIREVCLLVDKQRLRFIAREILFCSDLKNPEVFIKSVFPQVVVRHELFLVSVREAVNALLWSTATGPESSKSLMGMIQSTMGDKDVRRRKADLVARSALSGDFKRLQNLVIIDRIIATDKCDIFQAIFFFNPNAFLETTKVKNLCRILDIPEANNREYCRVLHLACISYLLVREKEGALSLMTRLAEEYKYSEAWRLTRVFTEVFGSCPSNALVAAMKVCPADELVLFAQRDSPKGIDSHTSEKIHFLERFPNLSDSKAVSDFIHSIGEDTSGMSFEHAELLANMHPADPEFKEFIDSLAMMTTIGCF